MSKVTLYQFEVYDIRSDGMTLSRSWGTREAVVLIAGGRVVASTAVEVDQSAVESESELSGFTRIGFSPYKRQGFQTQV